MYCLYSKSIDKTLISIVFCVKDVGCFVGVGILNQIYQYEKVKLMRHLLNGCYSQSNSVYILKSIEMKHNEML